MRITVIDMTPDEAKKLGFVEWLNANQSQEALPSGYPSEYSESYFLPKPASASNSANAVRPLITPPPASVYSNPVSPTPKTDPPISCEAKSEESEESFEFQDEENKGFILYLTSGVFNWFLDLFCNSAFFCVSLSLFGLAMILWAFPELKNELPFIGGRLTRTSPPLEALPTDPTSTSPASESAETEPLLVPATAPLGRE